MMRIIALCLPEAVFLLIILALFLQSLFSGKGQGGPEEGRARVKWLPLAALIALAAAVLSLSATGTLFHQAYRLDALSQIFKTAICAGFLVATLNAAGMHTRMGLERCNYFLFLAISTFGLLVMCSAVEMITMYVAMELSSYSLYVLTPMRAGSRRAAEAGIKYILFGAAVTAVALYGYSFILAAGGSGYLSDLAALPPALFDSGLAAVGLTLFMAGLLFKLALFPLHFWAPDVYQGTSHETAAFISAMPKLGAVVVLIRLAALFDASSSPALVIAILGAASMTFGNLVALVQKDVRRMLGYSAVAHAGYLAMGLCAGSAAALAATVFYGLIYALMIMACFFILGRLAPQGHNLNLSDLRGLYRRMPMLTLALSITLVSMIGLPPTAGFIGKFFLFTSAWSQGYAWLVIVGAINTVISLGYYLLIIRTAYADEPRGSLERAKAGGPSGDRSAIALAAALLMTALTLLFGVLPGPLMKAALAAVRALIL